MTLVASRLEALVVARAAMAPGGSAFGDLIAPLARFAPAELTGAVWRDRLAGAASELRAHGVLDARHRLVDADELTRRIGGHTARTWPQLADRVLPGLALAIAPDDGKLHARLAGRDAWAAAIVGRTLGLWFDGPPPSLAGLCDALAWRELALPGKPKRCPDEIRAVFVQRLLRSDAGPPERLVRVLAAREVGAPRPELRALRDALVRCWLSDRAIGPARADATPHATETPHASDDASPDGSFASDVLDAADATRDGWFGDRKVFVSPVWHELRRNPRWSAVTLDDFKARLVAAHRAGELALARADLVAAMDPELVAASEITADGASFHFIVKDPVEDPGPDDRLGSAAQGARSPDGEDAPRGEPVS
jgi:hypothetical protein